MARMIKKEREETITNTAHIANNQQDKKQSVPTGKMTVEFNPETSLVLIFDIKHADLIGNTDLLTQTFGHGMTKDIKCDVWASRLDENNNLYWEQHTISARTGNVLRYNLAGMAHKLIQESKTLGV